MNALLFAASSDIFGMGHVLLTRLGGLAGLVLVLIVGGKALGHVAGDRPAAAIAIILFALIPAWFIFDPTSATTVLKNTLGHL